MVKETFDLPDGGDGILEKAERFLRKKIKQLGGELVRNMEARDHGEYPSFEAQFDLPADFCEDDEEEKDGIVTELMMLFRELEEVRTDYTQRFAKYL